MDLVVSPGGSSNDRVLAVEQGFNSSYPVSCDDSNSIQLLVLQIFADTDNFATEWLDNYAQRMCE